MTVPVAVLDALQAHIDRSMSDLRHKYRDNTEACNALTEGVALGKLQEYVYAQKREAPAIHGT